jgi:hypothetical protein
MFFQEAVDHFGLDNQILKTVEELAELQKELIKYLFIIRAAEDDLRYLEAAENSAIRVREEIADVKVMLAQMTCAFGKSEIEIVMGRTIESLQNRIRKEKKIQAEAYAIAQAQGFMIV